MQFAPIYWIKVPNFLLQFLDFYIVPLEIEKCTARQKIYLAQIAGQLLISPPFNDVMFRTTIWDRTALTQTATVWGSAGSSFAAQRGKGAKDSGTFRNDVPFQIDGAKYDGSDEWIWLRRFRGAIKIYV